MNTASVDTSVVVAGLATWHPDHDAARAILHARPPALAHVVVESFSVLTRLPAPRRLDPTLVLTALRRLFPIEPIALPPSAIDDMLGRLVSHGIAGGATYDAMVGETARLAGLALHSLDGRARRTYEAIGVDVIWLGAGLPTMSDTV